MANWSVDEWVSWWADGLDVWFSTQPVFERERAFAPIRINSDREELVTKLAEGLRRLYPDDGDAAKYTLEALSVLHKTFETATLVATSRQQILRSLARATAFIRVCNILRAGCLSQVLRNVVIAIDRRWIRAKDLNELLSEWVEAYFDHMAGQDFSDLEDRFEALLRENENFVAKITYSMRVHSEVLSCIAKFQSLLLDEEDNEETWRETASALNSFYTKPRVERALNEISGLSATGISNIFGLLLAADGLAPFYRVDTLSALMSRHQPEMSKAGAEMRQLEVSY